MTISVKPYLMPFSRLFALMMLSLMLSFSLSAKVNLSPLFIQLSDVMESVKKNDNEKSQQNYTALLSQFNALENHDSPMGLQVQQALQQAQQDLSLANLEVVSKALIAFETEQNPVDRKAQRAQFAKRVMPVYEQLNKAIIAQDLESIQNEYKRFNTTWSINEMPVRETSLGHYGQIETAMTMIRVAMLADPPNYAEMAKQSESLGTALNDFKAGNILQAQTSNADDAPQNLASGIQLLEKAYQQFNDNQIEQGQASLTLFIQQWPIFEGEVSTRNGELYSRVESELPVILAKGNQTENLAQFQKLIDDLSQIDTGSYTMFDAMLILLREGLEALLIIMALVTSLKAANQPRAKRWVYAGAVLGVGASILGAVALQQFFPALSAGTNREIIEGAVGVIAVVMMLFIGAWLHSKSSVQGWKKFVDSQVSKAIATGSLISMMSLSFLSVFREGAETILFYVGMLPLIELQDLLLGIGLAIGLLIVIALAMNLSTKRLPMHLVFKLMTVLIYLLAFKILGVSIHALQLTNSLPTHLIDNLPTITWLGFYPNWEGICAQLIYLILIPLIARFFKH